MISRFKHSRELYLLVKQCTIFQDMTYLEWRSIESILHERDYRPKEIIFEQGEEGMGVYMVVSGSVQVARVDEGELKAISVLKTTDIFGEMTLIDGGARMAQAVAIEETKLLGFFRPDLLELIKTHPRIAAKVYSRLAALAAQRLRQMVEFQEKSRKTP